MPTMESLRVRVRLRLEEFEPAVWTDDEIDEAIGVTLEEYSHLFPREDRAEVVVPEGATVVAGPDGTFEVLRVVLENGTVLPRRSAPVGRAGDEMHAWEWFSGELIFSRPVGAQTLTVWLLANHTVTQVPEADAGLLVLGGGWRALQQRGVQDLKRGGAGYNEVTRAAEREYERALDRRRRRVRSRVMGAA